MRLLLILAVCGACTDGRPDGAECAAPRAVAVGSVACVVDCDGALACVDAYALAPFPAPQVAPVVAVIAARGASGYSELTVLDEAGGVRQLALPAPIGTGEPAIELAGLPRSVELTAGDSHVCARDGAGAVWCWGRNDVGQLGIGVDELRFAAQPRPVIELSTPVDALVAGGFATCAITGAVTRCWGALPRAAIGIAEVPALAGAGTIAVGGGEGTAEACVLVAGTVTCTHVEAPGGPFTAIATTGRSACALDDAGVVTCWGEEFDHLNQRAVSATPAGDPRFNRLLASGTGAIYCGIAATGSVSCWGGSAWRAEPQVIWSPPAP